MLLGLAMALGLVLVHQFVLEALEREREPLVKTQLAMGSVSRDAAGLLVLTHEYLLNRGGRAQRQWHAVLRSVNETLGTLDGSTHQLAAQVGDFKAVTDGLPSLFAALEAASTSDPAAADPARTEMLSAQLVTQTRRISDAAFDLQRRLADARSQLDRRLRWISLAVNVAFGLLLLGLMALVMRRVLRPMKELGNAARRMEQGDLSARSDYVSADEFGDLSQSFDAMAQSLQERQSALEAMRRDLQTVLDAVPSMIGYWDRDLDIGVVNRAYLEWFGVDAKRLTGMNMRELLPPELFEKNRPHIEAALRGEPQVFERSIPLPSGNGLRHTLTHYLPDRVDGEMRGFYAVLHDITELTEGRQRLASALRENEALLGSIRNHALFLALDAEGRIIDVNDKLCQLSGYERKALLGQTLRVFRPSVPQGDFDTALGAHLRAGTAWHGELCYHARDGKRIWTQTIIAPVPSPDGRVQRFVAIHTDISATRQLTRELRHANDRFELATASAGLGVWEYDIAAGTLLWDDRMYALYGQAPGQGLQPYALWSSSLHPEDKAASEHALKQAIAGTSHFEVVFRIVWPDGQTRHLRAYGRATRDAAGRPLRMIGVNADVTEQVQTEAALSASERLLRHVGKLTSVGGWRLDIPQDKVFWSPQTREIHEVPESFEPDLDSAAGFFAPESRTAFAQAVEQARQTGANWDLELQLITYAGRSLWVRSMGEVTRDANGAPDQIVGAIQDISDKRRMEDLLRAATSAAEAASAAKSAFLANISQEIRAPLQAIVGVAHLLDDNALNDEQRHLVDHAQRAGRSLVGIVNNVLDLARIEAGDMWLDEFAYEPATLLSDLTAIHGDQAVAKGLRLTVHLDPAVPKRLIGDPVRLQHMLSNLLSNAIRFTPQGDVRLSLLTSAVRSDASTTGLHCQLVAKVEDTGIGIPAHLQRHLFSAFLPSETATTGREGGSGLGLAIVKGLATVMGGEVGMQSQPGAGSEFWFSVPQLLPGDDEAPTAQAHLAGTLEVAVVSDNPAQQQELVSQVTALGWRALPVASTEALAQDLEQREAGGQAKPDLLLMGGHQPDIDGSSALASLARAGAPPRPVTPSDLFNAVNQALAGRHGSTERVLLATRLDRRFGLWLAGVRVLLVDGSDINLNVARRLLERAGAQVQACDSAADAMAALRSEPSAFDAVMLDLQLTGVDSLEITRQLRQDLGLGELPVIGLTDGQQKDGRQRALDAGLDEFLNKPLDPARMVRSVRRLVETYRGSVLTVVKG
jgi:PAS domain S-box-containing protein